MHSFVDPHECEAINSSLCFVAFNPLINFAAFLGFLMAKTTGGLMTLNTSACRSKSVLVRL